MNTIADEGMITDTSNSRSGAKELTIVREEEERH